MDAVTCKNISKVFYKGPVWKRVPKVNALTDINFNIKRGEIFGIVGLNGSGKSTLVRILSTLLIPDKGAATVFDYNLLTDIYKIRQVINRVSVEGSFFKALTVWENLRYFARLYNLDIKEAKEKAINILGKIGIKKKEFTKPMEELSRGMQQKIAIARGLLTSPMLFLLDEPTSGLEPRSKKEVQDFVLDTVKKDDVTVLLTTHDMVEAEKLCDRVAVINEGKFIALDTPDALKQKSKTSTLEELFLKLTEEGEGEEE